MCKTRVMADLLRDNDVVASVALRHTGVHKEAQVVDVLCRSNIGCISYKRISLIKNIGVKKDVFVKHDTEHA